MEVFAGFLDHTDTTSGGLLDFLEEIERARQHDDRPHLGQRCEPGGRPHRPAGAVYFNVITGTPSTSAWRTCWSTSTSWAARSTTTTTDRLGAGRQHPPQALQAEHPRRRHPRPDDRPLARPNQGRRRHPLPVPPRHRRHADRARGRSVSRRQRCIKGVEQMPIEGTSFAYTFDDPAANRRSKETPVLRDARPPRDLARRLEGRRLPPARHRASRTTAGSSTTSTTTSPSRSDLAAEHPRAPARAGRPVVGRGAQAQRPPDLGHRHDRLLAAGGARVKDVHVLSRHKPRSRHGRAKRRQPLAPDHRVDHTETDSDGGRTHRAGRAARRLHPLRQGQPPRLRVQLPRHLPLRHSLRH